MTNKAKKPEAKVKPAEKVARIAKVVMTPKAAVKKAEPIPDTAKQKKAVIKVNKEDELSRRLTRAKSSLMSGVEAALQGTSKPTVEAKAETEVKNESVFTPPAQAAKPVKPAGKIDFSTISNQAKKEEEPIKTKPVQKLSGKKVSFDDLVAHRNAQPQSSAPDFSKYMKK